MNTRLLLRIIGGVLFLVLIIILIVNIASVSEEEGPINTEMPQEASVLEDTQTSRVRYTLAGPIVAREEYKEIRITVDKDERKLELINGYNNNVKLERTFTNDSSAYRSFIAGINSEGFLLEQEAEYDSYEGVCPEGERMIIEYFNNGDLVKTLFSTSCSSNHGNLAGDDNDIEDLFEDQIPNYRELLSDNSHRI